jgi:hypothetical protein
VPRFDRTAASFVRRYARAPSLFAARLHITRRVITRRRRAARIVGTPATAERGLVSPGSRVRSFAVAFARWYARAPSLFAARLHITRRVITRRRRTARTVRTLATRARGGQSRLATAATAGWSVPLARTVSVVLGRRGHPVVSRVRPAPPSARGDGPPLQFRRAEERGGAAVGSGLLGPGAPGIRDAETGRGSAQDTTRLYVRARPGGDPGRRPWPRCDTRRRTSTRTT